MRFDSTMDFSRARWGGEEFVVPLSHTGAEGARDFAERLRARIEERVSVPGPAGPEPVTIPARTTSEGELIAGADAVLYAARARRRNRVMTDQMLRGAPRS